MEPTYRSGQTFVFTTISGSDVRRGDVVLLHSPWVPGLVVKRVVAVGGDHISQQRGGPLLLNGTALDEPYLQSRTYEVVPFTVTVPPGRMFLLGDNRDDSLDSRFHQLQDSGTVPVDAVVARDQHSPVWGAFAAAGAGMLSIPLLLLAIVLTIVALIIRRRPRHQ